MAILRTVKDRQAKPVLVWLCSGVARLGVARLGMVRFLTTLVQARVSINAGGVGCVWLGMEGQACCGEVRRLVAWPDQAGSGLVGFWNRARLGTELDQRQRRGMCHGSASFVEVGRGAAWPVDAWRVGAVLVELQTAIAVGAVRLRRLVAACTMEWCCGLSLGMVRLVEAWIFKQGGFCGR